VPDVAGEVSFEAAQRLACALAFGAFAVEVGARFGVTAGAGDGDAVKRRVELAVAAAVEALSAAAAGANGDRGDTGGSRELGVGGEALDAGGLTDQLGRYQQASKQEPLLLRK
jgi:hypothetical protein